jgi:hypothetical protein
LEEIQMENIAAIVGIAALLPVVVTAGAKAIRMAWYPTEAELARELAAQTRAEEQGR